jgi:phosphoribosylformimino-5-aminoimidazole carboxamide ribotide isomerase
MLLIPAIDLLGGRCVRLYQGDFGAQTRYEYSPRELLEKYRALGVSWVHVVDLDGAREGVLANREVIVDLAVRRGLKLQVGGGIRSAEVIEDLLSSGIERVIVGSAAVERPDEVIGWLARFGADRICLALDIRHDPRGEPQVRTRGWKSEAALSLWEALNLYPAAAFRASPGRPRAGCGMRPISRRSPVSAPPRR